MRYFIIPILACILFISHANAGTHTLNWEVQNGTQGYPDRLGFDGAIYNKSNEIPQWRLKVSGQIVDHAYLTNAEYGPLSPFESSLINSENFKESPEIEVYLSNVDGEINSSIYISPFRIDEESGLLEKLISFDLEFIEAKNHSSLQKNANSTVTFKTNSVLSSGEWYKLGLINDGIYILNYNYLIGLSSIFNGADLSSIKLYGNGGDMLPEINTDPRIDDLQENPMYQFDQNGNGKFDAGDYFLFYGDGTDEWQLSNSKFERQLNYYSDTSFYFITVEGSGAKRIQNRQSLSSSPTNTFTSFDYRYDYQQELNNLLNSGRKWYGELFDFTLNQNFPMSVPNMDPNQNVCIDVNFVGQSTPYNSSTKYSVRVNNQLFAGPVTIGGSTAEYGVKAREKSVSNCILPANNNISDNFSVTILYDKNGYTGAKGYLDYIRLEARRFLIWDGKQLDFRRKDSNNGGVYEYQLSSVPNDLMIWDITDPINPLRQNINLSGSNANFRYQGNNGEINEFIAFNTSLAPNPISARKIQTQNLHSHQPKQLVIVTHPAFYSEAERLAEYKRNDRGLSVQLVKTTEIYNEFSSGKQDLSAIRDYLKMLYDRGSSLENVLLFGDCSYDYKNIKAGNTNFVPVFESPRTLDNIDSYSSEDYITFLEDGMGDWRFDSQGQSSHKMSIGVGRFPVKSLEEAAILVDKVIHYETKSNLIGDWLNRATFVADDGDGNLHMNDANTVARRAELKNPSLDIQKIYLDAFPEIPSPSGALSIGGKNALDRALQDGTLILNYSGHGGEIGWTEEQLLRLDQIPSWGNYDKLSFFFTATCEFGRYDDPGLVSGGELVLLTAGGGAISIMTTTRPVYASANRSINLAFYDHVFERDANGELLNLGEVIRRTKNQSEQTNNRNFALLGDPSIRLNLPDKKVRVTEINGFQTSMVQDTLKALCLASVKGEIVDLDDSRISDFDGKVDIKVYDKALNLQTLGNGGSKYSYSQYKNLLFKGKATVNNGEFTVQFVVPKDIDYNIDKGRISAYAYRDDKSQDASGFDTSFYVGSSCDSIVLDNDPPLIQLFMDDTTFVPGGFTSQSPLLLAYLEDENGINFTGTGIGHDITATVSAIQGEKIILNDYYLSELDSYQKGSINYRLKDIPEGNHILTLKAWDTHNNSAEKSVPFVVASNEEMAFNRVINYPNPFNDLTFFSVDHNKAEQNLKIMINIYDDKGKMVKSGSFEVENSLTKIDGLNYEQFRWDGTNSEGEKLSNGVYHYKIQIKSLEDGSSEEAIKRLVYIK